MQTRSDKGAPAAAIPSNGRGAGGSTCTLYEGNRKGRRLYDLSTISDALKEPDAFVWFDVIDPTSLDLKVIQEEFALHPLAIEDAIVAHQRPKIEAYGSYWFIIIHAVTQSGDNINVHEIAVFAGPKFIVTVRDVPPYPLDEILRRWSNENDGLRCDSGALLYEIFDTVVDGYSKVAESYDEKVERIEDALFTQGRTGNETLMGIFAMKKDVQRFGRAVAPMREILAPIIRGDVKLFESDELPYYRDVYDHTVHVIDQMDAARDLVNNALEIYISIGTNRQNEVAKQLTIIATIFLPLTYLTGFFGQNFGFLTNHTVSPMSFWLFGVGTEVVAFVFLVAFFKYRDWF